MWSTSQSIEWQACKGRDETLLSGSNQRTRLRWKGRRRCEGRLNCSCIQGKDEDSGGGRLANRRQALLQIAGLSLCTALPSFALADARLLAVGDGKEYKTIQQAVRTARTGDVITIAPGLYRERIILDKSLTLEADRGEVTIEWRTSSPYESTVQCSAAKCKIKGITILHASPSVANNYAILNQGGQLSLASCTVTSATGAGIGTEGGQLVVRDSTISNNRGNGVVCVADLSGNPSSCLVNGSRVVRNALNGILVREDSRLLIRNSAVSYNKLYGLLVKGGELSEEGNVYAGNARGALSRPV